MNDLERYNKELYHYGVVGMKWGIRKARNRGETYSYRSMGQKRYEKKLAAQKAKGASAKRIAKTSNKLEILKARDRNRQDYASKTSTGKSIAKTLIMGPLGSGNYNRLRAAGKSRISSALLSNWLTGTLGYPVSLAYSRGAEKRTAKRDIEQRKRRGI